MSASRTFFSKLGLALLFAVPTALAGFFYQKAQHLAQVAEAPTTKSATSQAAAPKASPPAAIIYSCPMHPNFVSDQKGECPICGMTLVARQAAPALAESKDAAPVPGLATITIDAQRQQLIGLRPVVVKTAPFSGSLRTTGRIAYDETRVHDIHTKYEAYVERLYADYTGKFVKRGEPLVSLYSPDLYNAEQEYLIALKSGARPLNGGTSVRQNQSDTTEHGGGVDIVESSREKLRLWDVSGEEIARLHKSGRPQRALEIYAPISGFILNKSVVHGSRVEPKDSLFRIADLSRVWVIADVYEYELGRVSVGQTGTITLPYLSGRTFLGRTSYIYPEVDPKTRTVKLRLEVDNQDGALKVDMLANVEIKVSPKDSLVVPEDSVIETGERKVVFLVREGNRLEPREVQISGHADHLYQVSSGLSEGDKVAAGASFLLDSESRIRAVTSAPEASEKSAPPTSHEHHP